MSKIIFLLYLQLLKITIFAEEANILTPPPAIFVSKEISTFMPQVPKVNVTTGEYSEESCDLTVAGIEPLSLRRFYSHQGHKDTAFGHWSINPEALILFNFEGTQSKFVGAGKEDGSFILCERKKENRFYLDTSKCKGFSNSRFDELNGQSHPLNTSVSYRKLKKHKNDLHCHWEGIIEEGDGAKRSFKTDTLLWPQDDQKEYVSPLTPPFQAQVSEYKQPNGNVIRYEYEDFNEPICHADHRPRYYILKSIKAYTSKGALLGAINLCYLSQIQDKKRSRWIEQINISGSDGRQATLYHRIREVQPEKKKEKKIVDIVLDHVEASGKPAQFFNYRWEKAATYFNAPYMFSVACPEQRSFETEYDLNSKKVKSQNAPIGPNGEMIPISRYEYHQDHTIVYDGENNKTIYRFNNDKRITHVEKYQGEKLYSVEHNEWDSNTGNLSTKKISDGSGKLFRYSAYKYDKNHNVIEEKVGDKTSSHIILRTYSDDGFNLKLTESDRPDKIVRYSYIPETNLLASEFVYEKEQIRKRTFHFYDPEINSAKIKTIVDDGHSQDPYDLNGVTFRQIIEIDPKRSKPRIIFPTEKNLSTIEPCIGLPEEVREKTIDAIGNEVLLKKVRYTYHPSGKISKEEHYDANNQCRFSIINEYDEHERLKSSTDALGHTTTFEYDANFNLIEIHGPRADMHKKITYDKANRPTILEERQSDGSYLKKEHRYNKCGRIITSINECGHTTFYEYDALGRIIKVTYPDGTFEEQSFDVLNNVIESKDAKGYVTKKTYDYRGNILDITYPDGTCEKFTYNAWGILSTHIDHNHLKNFYSHDVFDHPTEINSFSLCGELVKKISSQWSPFFQRSSTDPLGRRTEYAYDFAGRKVLEKFHERIIEYIYDEFGRVCKTRKEEIDIIENYDLAGHLIEKRTEQNDKIIQRVQYAYDEMGNKTHLITSKGTTEIGYNTRGMPQFQKDLLGNTTTFSYSYTDKFIQTITNPKGIQSIVIHDLKERPCDLLIKNANGETLQHIEKRYDNNDNVSLEIEHVYVSTTPQKTILHKWNYGPRDRIECCLEADTKETSYRYDDMGRLKEIVKPDNTILTHVYDEFGRLSRYFSKDFDYNYQYDLCDNMLEVTDLISHTSTKRSYDFYGHLEEETLGNELELQFKHDPWGHRKLQTLPDGSTIEYHYQNDNLYEIRRKGVSCIYATRDLEGNPTLIHLPGDVGSLSIKRDALSRWKEVLSPYFSAYFSDTAYDRVGNLLHAQFVDPIGAFEETYSYDDLNQLTHESSHTYTFDSLYNRIQKDETINEVNSLCQLTHDGKNTYTYDANGNLKSDGVGLYDYDAQDRLIQVNKGNLRIEFGYDPFHRRLFKKVFVDENLTKSFRYIWDGNNEIGVVEEEKMTELRVLGEGYGAEIGAAILYELHGKTYIPIHDHRGGVAVVVDAETKEVAETYRYTAFGEQLVGGELSPWRFASKRFDKETNFLFFGRRYYCPEIGRWITSDPQGFADGPNLYAYVQNNPLTHFDLYGLERKNNGLLNYIFDSYKRRKFHFWQEPPWKKKVCNHYYPESERRFAEKSKTIPIPGIKLPLLWLGYCNGFLNRELDARGSGLYLSGLVGGCAIDVGFRPTHGFFHDLHEAIAGLWQDKLTNHAIEIHKMWDWFFDHAPPNAVFLQYSHSHGTIDVRNALTHYPKDRRNRIISVAIAPAAYISDTLCLKSIHYVSRDFVPYIDVRGRRMGKKNIVRLTPHKGAHFIDHSFTSPTYREAILTEFDSAYKKYVGDLE